MACSFSSSEDSTTQATYIIFFGSVGREFIDLSACSSQMVARPHTMRMCASFACGLILSNAQLIVGGEPYGWHAGVERDESMCDIGKVMHSISMLVQT